MLTQTSEIAIRVLIYLKLKGGDDPVSPRQIAQELDASPSYLAKITRDLVKAGLLRSHRGSMGGVTLDQDPDHITLLDIVQACQGLIVGSYCQGISDHPEPVCAFHEAMREVHDKTIELFSRWTLTALSSRPGPALSVEDPSLCRMGFVCGCPSRREKPKKSKKPGN
jgi:Rrf2 family protein